jgi:phosphatidylinositol-3-phosphatase
VFANTTTYERLHSISDVLSAVLDVGLQIELFHEFDVTPAPTPWLQRGPDGLYHFGGGQLAAGQIDPPRSVVGDDALGSPAVGRCMTMVLLAGTAITVGACSSSSGGGKPIPTAPSTTTISSTTATASTASTTTAGSARPAINHVFVIMLENKSYAETWGPTSPATYLNATLVPKGELLTNYYGVGHASLDNYIAQVSGQAPNPSTQADCATYTPFVATGTGADGQLLGKGCVFPSSVITIADQLTAGGKTWKAYEEDIGNSATDAKTCRHPALGSADHTLFARLGDEYATRHDPFVYFDSIINSPACATEVVGLDQLTADLASAATTPNLSYITPNLCHDGHDAPCVDGEPGGLVSSDRFLSEWVPRILASPAFTGGGMLVVTFDEAELAGGHEDASACCQTPADPNAAQPGLSGPGGGRVGALVVSAATKAGTVDATAYNHYGLLCSVEDVFGLSHLGFAGAPGTPCFGDDIYNG